MKQERSRELFERARRLLPGGVNSPVRSFSAVGGVPPFIASAEGPYVTDADGNRYIDYVGSWGPLILGHAPPEVVEAVAAAARRGTSYGAPTEAEVDLATAITTALPSMEMIRLVNSGTEATMSALRLARAYTGRELIVKFDGCYHGHSDALLVQAGSGPLTLGIPGSAGVPAAVAATTLSLPYNDLPAVEQTFEQHPGRIAAVIVEPIAANMGVVPPVTGFLKGLQRICRAAGALLIFDEVITGFRVAYGGAQTLLGLTPDLTCLGKIIGGGLPVGAYGGRQQIMEMVAPLGPVYQAGTLSGNPLAMAAGRATLRRLEDPQVYQRLEALTVWLADGLSSLVKELHVEARVNSFASMLTLFFTPDEVGDYNGAKRSNTLEYARFFHALLAQGVYFPPSQFEAAFLSTAHQEEDVERTLQAAAAALEEPRETAMG